MKEYRARVQREGTKAWTGEIPGLAGTSTWHPSSLAGLRHSLAEAIVLAEDLPDEALDDVAARIEFTLADADGKLVEDTRKKRKAAEQQRVEAEQITATAVHTLRQRNFSTRDIAALTGVSHQRVAQISSEAGPGHASGGR